MSQDDISMEFMEQEDGWAPQGLLEPRGGHEPRGAFEPRTGSCTDVRISCPMTPFRDLTHNLPVDSLDTSGSMSQLPMTSSVLAPPPLYRQLSTSPQLIHSAAAESCSSVDVHRKSDDDFGSFGIFPVSGDDPSLMATSVPINIQSPRKLAWGKIHDGDALESSSVPNEHHFKNHNFGKPGHHHGRNGQREASPRHHNGDLRKESMQSGEFPKGSRLSIGSSYAGRFRPSLVGSTLFGSPSRKGSTQSIQRVNIITEAMSIFPSYVSEFSLESCTEFEEAASDGLALPPSREGFDATHSYQTNLNHLDEAAPSEDMSAAQGALGASLLHRSMSVPPRYEYNNQTRRKIFSLKEIFPELLSSKDEPVPSTEDKEREEVDEVGELPSATTPAKRKWLQTMPDLMEGPESETLTSQSSGGRLLSRAALAISRGEYDAEVTNEEALLDAAQFEAEKKAERRRYMKNLFVLCLSFFFVFTSYLSLRNLQSSINARGGLGMHAFSALYGCFFLGCISATTIVQRLRPKWSMLLCMIGIFLFDVVNFYPTFYTLIPVSGVVGFSLGVIWTAHATYLTNIAASYAQLTGERLQDVLVRFNGMHFVFYQLAQIVGGLLSSVVLNSSFGSRAKMPAAGNTTNETDASYWLNESAAGNNSMDYYYAAPEAEFIRNVTSSAPKCGTEYCPRQSSSNSSDVDPNMVYTLVGIFTVCSLIGILVMFLFLDRLEGTMKKSQATLGKQLGAVFRFYADRRVLCLVGIMFYSMLQSSFMFGEFTKSFVTCSLGVYMVGYVMVCQSASSGIASFLNGRIQRHVGRCALVLFGVLVQLVMLVTLLIWQPSAAQKSIFFIIAVFWGIGDGIVVSQTISIVGTLFSNNKEPAFSALKMTQSVALFSFFMTSQYICTIVKVLSVLVALILGTIGYLMLEAILHISEKKNKKAIIVVNEVKIVPKKDAKNGNIL